MAYLEVWETDKDEEYLWAKGPGIAVIVVSDAVFGLLLPPLVYMDTSQNPPLVFCSRRLVLVHVAEFDAFPGRLAIGLGRPWDDARS